MSESRENTKLLMTLKECVSAKARSVVKEEGYVHAPYRASKLTMLLKVRCVDFSQIYRIAR